MPRDVAAVCKIAFGVGVIAVALDFGLFSTLMALAVMTVGLHVLGIFDNE